MLITRSNAIPANYLLCSFTVIVATLSAQQGVTNPNSSSSGPPIGLAPANRSLPPGSSPAAGSGAVFLSGRIVMENGAPLPSTVAIERVCSISARTVAWTDAKGRFAFQWSGLPSTLPDASDSGSRSSGGMIGISPGLSVSGGGGGAVGIGGGGSGSGAGGALVNCDLRARLAGYRSDVISVTSRHETDNPNLGIIVLHRLSGINDATVSSTSLGAPPAAKSAYQKGIAALQAGASRSGSEATPACGQAVPHLRGLLWSNWESPPATTGTGPIR